MSEKLLTAKQVAHEKGLREAEVIRLRKQRKIPSVQLGYRTFRFHLSRVEAALDKLEVKAVKP
jgi:predicted DNA-binding transcriptional regulator AlpA